ncbi:hypothetical protein CGCF415_v000761 [Colletotrichum fructicola]|uniref:Uncharacterized protein n=1 Tax=Colletotrichum fructicola (strain Nara gc5) TaxID=1213859 RepID=L2G4I6_COLFN|nr:uncharacterized protein CGMCC3_g14360 [Colletotrichum fructicola]KAF4486231.1 hypothetical protein CGGC5_v005694 [Colletotrichum fructicola Nara gc5]KAE9569503.1 hypothetical protein CGMCC3_g14360 [Colletotrichum fructicola]KAF4423918.1 hypothetical protein CFRS1_v006900 [Colletotrichum fructicola]KAF4889814.1 hypothetical protein CGCFRS4_v009147 [Colletotrichum fructicola]KAF4916667.1 hypothetical protein CGCF415_v000761 [Colletotrichum fructicola]
MNNQQTGMAAPAHARYRYQKKPYHLPYQIKYLKLAIRIFNSDIHDILSSRQEKTMVIDDLSKELTNSEKRGPSGDCHNNRTVSLARQMQKGDKVVVKWQVCSAILRFQMNLPETWLNHPTFRQCYAGASYLINCITGVNTYSQEGLQRATYGAQSAGPQHNDNSRSGNDDARTGPQPSLEKTIGPRQAVQDDSGKRKAPETSSWSAESGGCTASGRQIFVTHGPGQKKRRADRDASTATLQGHVEVIEINSDDEDVKPAIKRQRKDAHHGRQENTDPHVNNNIGQINAAEAQHEVERQISTETNAANMQKTITELRKIMQFLPNIAASESKTFRKGILSPFITKIQSHSWNDLVRWADQLVVAKGRDSRQFVAEELREALAARVKDLSA